MWRYFAGGAGALLLALAAMFLFRGSAAPETSAPPPPPAAVAGAEDEALPDEAPSATAKTREEKRFNRVDKDKNDSITRDEYFTPRHKAFAKLDANGDGRLSFEEWAVKGIARFTGADKDKSGALTRTEFATTAVKRKAAVARCACAKAAKPDAKAPAEDDADGGE
jgi:hypothetical protein